MTTGDYMTISEDQTSTLLSRDYKDPQCVIYAGDNVTSPQNASNPQIGDPCHTLNTDSRNYVVIKDGDDVYAVENQEQHYIVRRLTPLECERLQGFPDGWTQIGEWVDEKGKGHKESADSARYKALGNSIAIPPWFYVLQRLSIACGVDKTMASLFDGIGGFPLIWEGLHGKGSCIWASEIEDFPIAVTKEHFKEADSGSGNNV